MTKEWLVVFTKDAFLESDLNKVDHIDYADLNNINRADYDVFQILSNPTRIVLKRKDTP